MAQNLQQLDADCPCPYQPSRAKDKHNAAMSLAASELVEWEGWRICRHLMIMFLVLCKHTSGTQLRTHPVYYRRIIHMRTLRVIIVSSLRQMMIMMTMRATTTQTTLIMIIICMATTMYQLVITMQMLPAQHQTC